MRTRNKKEKKKKAKLRITSSNYEFFFFFFSHLDYDPSLQSVQLSLQKRNRLAKWKIIKLIEKLDRINWKQIKVIGLKKTKHLEDWIENKLKLEGVIYNLV